MTTYAYDTAGRVTQVVAPGYITSTYVYDAYGNISATTDHNGKSTLYRDYNDFGQPGRIIAPDESETLITYNAAGLKSTVTDPKTNVTEYFYDANSRLIRVENALNDSTWFDYDSAGNLLEVADANHHTTTYGYDVFNRLVWEADPLHHTTTYEYGEGGCGSCGSDFGALVEKTDPKNQTTEYEYDGRGRLEKILYTGTADEVRFGYDAAGNRTAMGDSRLASTFGAGNLTFTWEYDTLGRVTKEIYPNGDYLTWSYNALGQRAAMRLPNGDIQTYAYDSPRGRLTEIVNPQSGTFEYTYNSFGQLEQIDYPSGLKNQYNYDADSYRLTRSKVYHPGYGVYWQNMEFQYDENGNLTQREDRNGPEECDGLAKFYTYDALNQLLTERCETSCDQKHQYTFEYEFDAVGNREQMVKKSGYYDSLTAVTTTYNYDAANRLEQRSVTAGAEEWTYEFDDNGNMTVEEEGNSSRAFTWNRDDRMTQVSNEFAAGSPTVSYVYDAMGRRIMRKKGSEWRMFFYDGLSVAAEKKSTNSGGAWAWDRLYTLAPGVIGHVLAQSQWSGSAWASTFLHYDHIGNVTLSTNSSGAVVSAYDQDAFGNPLLGPDGGLRLQTKELDPDAGLFYFFQRWYNSQLALMTSEDPILNLLSTSFNAFLNNPLSLNDPTGLVTWPNPQIPGYKCTFEVWGVTRRLDPGGTCKNNEYNALYDKCIATCSKLGFQGGQLVDNKCVTAFNVRIIYFNWVCTNDCGNQRKGRGKTKLRSKYGKATCQCITGSVFGGPPFDIEMYLDPEGTIHD